MSLSRMTRVVPFPLQDEEIKIHPSRERVNVSGLLDCEIEEASSNSEVTLFSFFSPENRIPAAAFPANAQTTLTIHAARLPVITRGYRTGESGGSRGFCGVRRLKIKAAYC